MGLFQRITASPPTISVHRWGAVARQWAAGELTRAQVIAAFNLTGSEVTEMDAIKATYDAIVDPFLRAEYLNKMEDVFYLCWSNDYPESKAKSALGF